MRTFVFKQPTNVPHPVTLEWHKPLIDHLGIDNVIEELTDPLPEGVIFWDTCGDVARLLKKHPKLRPDRLFIMGCSWQHAAQQLEDHKVLGCIDSLSESCWLCNRYGGFWGLKTVVEKLGLETTKLFSRQSPNYIVTWNMAVPEYLKELGL